MTGVQTCALPIFRGRRVLMLFAPCNCFIKFVLIFAFVLIIPSILVFDYLYFEVLLIYCCYFLLVWSFDRCLEPDSRKIVLLFVLYIFVAILFIALFSMVAHSNNLFPCVLSNLNKFSAYKDHFYFSARIFISLSGPDLNFLNDEEEFFILAQSLLGSAYSVTFITILLLKSEWIKGGEGKVYNDSSRFTNEHLKYIELIPGLVRLAKVAVALIVVIVFLMILILLR